VVLTIVLILCLGALLLTARRYGSPIAKWVQAEFGSRVWPTSETPLFSGFVEDDRGDPLPGVKLTAPALNIPPQTTDPSGWFSFRVNLPAGTNFRLIAQKPGFDTYSADPPSGDTTFNITLHQVQGGRNR
jgi:hypothetical protein